VRLLAGSHGVDGGMIGGLPATAKPSGQPGRRMRRVDAAARRMRSELAVPALPPVVAGPILLPRLTQLAMAILGALATRSRSSTDRLRVC